MLSCREATRLLSDAQDRRLSVAERVQLRLHVLMCGGCRRFGLQLGRLRNGLHHLHNIDSPDV